MSKIIQVNLENPRKCLDCNFGITVIYGLSDWKEEDYLCGYCLIKNLVKNEREIL